MIDRSRAAHVRPRWVVFHLFFIILCASAGVYVLFRHGLANVVLGLFCLVGIPIATFGYYCFDRLLWIEYTRHRDRWLADGRMRGFFWSANEARGTRRPVFAWFFARPVWATDPDAIAWFWSFRISWGFWLSALLAAAVTYFLSGRA